MLFRGSAPDYDREVDPANAAKALERMGFFLCVEYEKLRVYQDNACLNRLVVLDMHSSVWLSDLVPQFIQQNIDTNVFLGHLDSI